jgi:signal transduction histidine kinase
VAGRAGQADGNLHRYMAYPTEQKQQLLQAWQSREHGTARLDVTDNGTGIDPAILDRIFDPFFTTRDVGEGMGLGLHMCHAVVTAHGGTLTVTSDLGKGSTFRVELPAAPMQA